MTTTSDWIGLPLRALRGAAALLLRAAAALLGLALMLGLMLFGLLAGGVLLLWALLLGRRPAVRFGVMPQGAAWQRFRRGVGRPGQRVPAGEVVDIEAREVGAPPAPERR